MIGAVIAKKKAGSGFDALNRRDIASSVEGWAEDATWTFPGNIPISGEAKGKEAIKACFAKMIENYPRMEFTVKDVFISNIFAMGGTNNIAVEWEFDGTNRKGKIFHNRGVTVIRVKGSKVVAVREYVFDTDIMKEAWEE